MLDEWAGQWPIRCKPHALTTPAEGSTDPTSNDSVVGYHPNLVLCFGTSWWNWTAGQTEGCMFDFDFGHGPKALDEAGIAKTDKLAEQHPAIMVSTSKGGGGRHWAVFVEPMPAKTRADHDRNCHAILANLSALLGVDLAKLACSHGVIQYIYRRTGRWRTSIAEVGHGEIEGLSAAAAAARQPAGCQGRQSRMGCYPRVDLLDDACRRFSRGQGSP